MSDLASGQARWARACMAVWLLAVDPVGLGGVRVTARAGPVRDRWMTLLNAVSLPRHKLHPSVSDEVLFGGLGLSGLGSGATLRRRAGWLDAPCALVLTMAERCPVDLAGRLAQALDRGAGQCLIALEEQADPEEMMPNSLAERLACHVSLDSIPLDVAQTLAIPDVALAQARLGDVQDGGATARLTAIALSLGIVSLRSPWLAIRVARANAALSGRRLVAQEDIELACLLVLAPRARHLPEAKTDPVQDPPAPDTDPPPQPAAQEMIPQEMVIAAVQAVLPDGILAACPGSRGAGTDGAGARKIGNRRGRPKPARAGRLDGRNRIDLLATLRAAAPYQKLRPRRPGVRLALRSQDIRLKRFETCSDRVLVFAVDASGSQALTRLGEAKGAVELLLARAYASRDHAALIGFRGETAEILLPPTRSLTQTKRRLAALPGGGGTPLASGLRVAGQVAFEARRAGLSPLVVLLTDGRANVALDGASGRAQAQADAMEAGAWLHKTGLSGVVLDTGARPFPALADLARQMGAQHVPLPFAKAKDISTLLGAAVHA